MDWTSEQISAISAPLGEGAILVSAAAGSGKTAVLVERIITKILNEKTSIDRLLAVTFTRAAASEMREKIIKRMRAALKTESGKKAEYLREQIRLAQSADLLTIDSFCMRAIQNNYYALGTDPNFSIADSGEAELIKEDALDSLFTRLYCEDEDSEDGRRFNRMLDRYASNRDDEDVKKLVKDVYGFIQSFAKPDEWLTEKTEMYDEEMSAWIKPVTELFINAAGERYFLKFSALLTRAADKILPNTSDDAVKKRAVADAYAEMGAGLADLTETAFSLMNAKSWDEAHEIYEGTLAVLEYPDKMTAKNKPKNIEVDIEDWKEICKERNKIKKDFLKDCSVLRADGAQMLRSLNGGRLREIADDIAWLVREFTAEYERRKEIRNLKEHSDVEHLSYRLFTENEEICAEYRERYDEILIDEYQDTNELQDSIFRAISRDGKNLFMVGDLKQSIYGFRGGDPTIFKEKSIRYSDDATDNQRIILSQNFRSRQEILRAVNAVFERAMTDGVGDVNYGGGERIVRESDKDARDDRYKPEVIYTAFDAGVAGDVSEVNAEAEVIAVKIKEMLDSKLCVGADKRAVEAGDIAILSRGVRGEVGTAITSALERHGINSSLEIDDYFEKREISLMLSIISVIDNCMQDIPLVALMRSPAGGFTDNDLAKIRIRCQSGDLYSAVKRFSEGEKSALGYKCGELIRRIKRWKGYTKRKSVAELIWSIYEETGLYDFVGALDNGEEAQANLRLLYERARSYENAGFKGLFNFVRYIKRIQERRNDLSSASMSEEGGSSVRVMTMHKSKGLEFPVVFLFGTCRNIKGGGKAEKRLLLHKDLGLGLMYADTEEKYYEKTLCYETVSSRIKREELSEEMRILYVAATRAKDKLIITPTQRVSGTKSKTVEEIVQNQIESWRLGIPPIDATCYADWICPAAIASDTWEFSRGEFRGIGENENDVEAEGKARLTDELRRTVYDVLEYSYAYPLSGAIPTKTSVSALKRFENERDYSERKDEYTPVYAEDVPAFMRTGKKGSEIGTAHHNVMAFIDFERVKNADDTESTVRDEIKRIADAGEIERFYAEDEEMLTSITEHVAGFFGSRLGREMLCADEVYRERAFQINIPATRFDTSLGTEYDGETVILQGIIDCYYKIGDRVVLLDYKTDKCSSDADVQKISERYAVQLELYNEAVERITGRGADEKYLYLFAVGKEVRL